MGIQSPPRGMVRSLAMRFSVVRLCCVLLAIALLGSSACGKSKTEPSGPTVAFSSVDLTVGTGDVAVANKVLIVNYTGWLYDSTKSENKGNQFDTTVNKTPFGFKLGANLVIRGWEMGVPGMRVGGKRRLTIPSDLAYGSAGAGGGVIPPNAALVFEIELLEVRDQ